ncbi:MAG: ATP-binding protein [Terriglobia bacterium]|jgi:two-component system phosphate regulon sensor histidine kinase PhoR
MIFRSPIFRKLLANAFLLIAVTLVVLNFYITRYTADREVQSVVKRLEAEAQILETEAANVPAPQLEDWTHLAAQRSGARITIIDPKGVALADSQHDPETMENHVTRPEIMAAYQHGMGTSSRHSTTVNQDLCYLALRMTYHDEPGYILRLAVPLDDVDSAVAAVRWRILWASIYAALVALAIAYYFSQSFTQRIARLRAFAEGLVGAHFSQSPLPPGDDEMGALGRSLSNTAAQLRDLVDRLGVESAQREAILASMVEGVLAVDSTLRITFANASFIRAVGGPNPIPARMQLVELVRAPELREVLTRVLSTGESVKRRMQLPAADRVFEVQAAPLTSGTARGAIAILHDITDLERLERIRRDFVANVSHELRTPLTAIRGYAETLLEGALEDQENNRRFLEIIKAHAIRLNNISSDLLALSELESGKARPEPEPVSVRGAVESAMHTLEAEARLRSVSLVSDHVEDVQVLGDRLQIEQALVNLLDNAVKFNRPGGEARMEVTHTGDGRVKITLADTGIGIPHDDLPRIFERFYRVDKARSREVGGTGLGLSIVKHIIERANGTVSVESQLGKGSTFTLMLPAA